MEQQNDAVASTDVTYQSKLTTYRSTFNGEAATYFKIVIVNVLLTILTVGIYSAWAKVRNNKYLYKNTEIAGHNFDYLATPIQILKGRILALLLLAIFYSAGLFNPVFGAIATVALSISIPALIVLGLRFQLRMTVYRNVRFSFKGSLKTAYKELFLAQLITILTLGLGAPYAISKIHSFIYSNIYYGKSPLRCIPSVSAYYFAGLVTAAGSLLALIVVTFIAGVALGSTEGEQANIISSLLPIVIMFIFFVFNSVGLALIRNAIFNAATLHLKEKPTIEGFDLTIGELNPIHEQAIIAKFGSDIPAIPYAGIIVTNYLAVIFTVGLAYPWATVRKAKFLAKHTVITIDEALFSISDSEGEETSSFTQEASDVFDVDIGLV